jgi:hypothetical protein
MSKLGENLEKSAVLVCWKARSEWAEGERLATLNY